MKYLMMFLLIVASAAWSMTPEQLQKRGKAVSVGQCVMDVGIFACQQWKVGKETYVIVFVRHKGEIIPAAVYKVVGDGGERTWLNPILDRSI